MILIVEFGNLPGNIYSRHHTSKNPDVPSSGFWNFTFHEMGTIDNPAVIDFILSETKFDKIKYIGHSQGTTTLIIMLSSKPKYNDKIDIACLMAPSVFLEDVGYKVRAFIEPFLSLRVIFEI